MKNSEQCFKESAINDQDHCFLKGMCGTQFRLIEKYKMFILSVQLFIVGIAIGNNNMLRRK